MSYEGKPFAIWRFNLAQMSGKKEGDLCIIKLYPASQFKQNCPIKKRNSYPSRIGGNPEDYWTTRYRLMVNGRWYKEKSKQYCFYTLSEALLVFEVLL